MGVEEKAEEEKLSPTTIFINGLPPTFTNDDLKTHFEKFGAWKSGEVSFRAKRSRGYAFIEFEQESAAVKAREEMNGKEVGADAPIVVLQARERTRPRKEKKEKAEPSAEKREKAPKEKQTKAPKPDAAAAVPSTTELFVKNLPPTFVDDDLEKAFAAFGPLKHSYVCWRRDQHRGYGFVKFNETAHAAAAAEKMNGQTVGGGDKPLRVEFSTQSPKQSRASKKSASKDKERPEGDAAPKEKKPREPKSAAPPAEPRAARAKVPKPPRAPKVVDANAPLSKLSLFVGGLPETVGTDELTAKFAKFGELSDAFVSVRGKRHRGFGFATFTTEASAKAALDALNGKELPESKAGKPITVTYAREKPSA